MAEDFIYTPCKDIKKPFYVEDGANLEIALTLAGSVINDPKSPANCFCFGFPGTGKSAFVKALAYKACKEYSFKGVLEIFCLRIARQKSGDARQRISDILEIVFDMDRCPMIAFFDEIDTIARNRTGEPSEAMVTETTMSLFKDVEDLGQPCFVVGLTNLIDNCDAVIKTHIGPKIYFPPPSEKVLVAILEASGARDPKATARHYLTLCGKDARPVHRNLGQAIKNLRVVLGTAWNTLPADELADQLRNLAEPVTVKEVDEYESSNKRHIDAAKGLENLIKNRRSSGTAGGRP